MAIALVRAVITVDFAYPVARAEEWLWGKRPRPRKPLPPELSARLAAMRVQHLAYNDSAAAARRAKEAEDRYQYGVLNALVRLLRAT